MSDVDELVDGMAKGIALAMFGLAAVGVVAIVLLVVFG